MTHTDPIASAGTARLASSVVYAAPGMTTPVLGGLAALPAVRRLIELALDEDLGRGDATSRAVFGAGGKAGAGTTMPEVVADMVARDPIVAFGIEVAAAVFTRVDPAIAVEPGCADGSHVDRGAVLATVRGPALGVLAAERTALNFIQRLSGVATLARRYADAVVGTRARVVDTRKTTPGFRALEKAAVAAGGCGNHRFDLGSGILIKDNHIAACGSVRAAVEAARAGAPHLLRVEVEVTNLGELDEALAAGAEVVLLDNMSPAQVEVAAARAHGRGVLVEVSGGITLATIADYARAGADLISVGAITHSAPAVDIGLDVRA
jgi:nicotinate-nucleotide pyrophosphorylase (carboxylating)